MNLGRNQGGIRRGDRADTGDLEARPTEGVGPGGSGVPGGEEDATGHPTANPDALGGESNYTSAGVAELGGNGDLEDLTIHEATDPELGLTDVGEIPAQDWAADSGPTRSGEGGSHGVDRRLAERDVAPDGHKIHFERRGRK